MTTSYNLLAQAIQKSSPTTAPLFPGINIGSPHASGGPVSGNTAYLVGEKGPEMFVPNGGGTIIPNSELNSGGGMTININNPSVRNDSDITAITNSIMSTLARQQELARYKAYK